MVTRRPALLAVVMFAAVGSTGCLQALKIADASFRLTGAIVQVAAAVAASSGGSSSSGGGSSACCYTRENPTPVRGAVDRPMSQCELARGRWREANQDQDEVPAELRCLADGSYPRVSAPAVVSSPATLPDSTIYIQDECPPASEEAAASADTI